MEEQTDESHSYLNKTTGEVVLITDDNIEVVQSEEDWSDYQDWEQEELQQTKEVLGSDDYIELPSKFDIHEYTIMERFCNSVENQRLRYELLSRIQGSGAFRRFKEAIYRNGIQDAWFRYKQEELEAIAINWLQANEIEYKAD